MSTTTDAIVCATPADAVDPGAPRPDAGPAPAEQEPVDAREGADAPRVPTARGWRAALRRRVGGGDAGMATAEYAIATVAAAGFAGLLIAILRSDEVRGLLMGIVRGALAV